MFQFRRFPSYSYFIQSMMRGYCPRGFPHSDIPGSLLICSSPRLFAACRVLHRLLMPRHSPCALFSLTMLFSAVLAIISNHAGFNRIFSFAKLFFTLNNFKVFHFRFVCQSLMISHLRLPSVALLFSSLLCSVFKVQKRRFRVRFKPVYRSVVENSGIEPLTS